MGKHEMLVFLNAVSCLFQQEIISPKKRIFLVTEWKGAVEKKNKSRALEILDEVFSLSDDFQKKTLNDIYEKMEG